MSPSPSLVARRVSSVVNRLIQIASLATVLSPSLASAQSLPSGWTGGDVGSPVVAGTATSSGTTFTLEGAGTDIWDPTDQFQFIRRQVTGDVTIIARLSSLEQTDPLAKAGLMIRESLAGNSRHAFAVVSAGRGLGFLRRATTGGTTAATIVPGTAPMWLRLERRGSTFTVARSTDGSAWTNVASTSITMGSDVYVGLVVSSHFPSTLATATFANVSVTTAAPPLPTSWSSSDIGSPARAGSSSSSSSSAFTVTGGGIDIWDTSDQFRYVYQQVSGDVDVIAQVASFQAPDAWSKAGVMIRESLNANAAHASTFATGTRGISFQRRPATGLASNHSNGGAGAAPVWVKLERRGSAITSFRSANGTSWTMIGSQTLSLPTRFYVGLAVTSHLASSTATANFTNVSVGVASAPTPPTVSLTSPNAGATFTAPASVTMNATASDSDNGVASVEFYANGTLLGTDSSSPYAYSWSNVAQGSYSLTAVARDTSGAVTTSAERSITVNAPTANQPPTVGLTAPGSGSTYTAPASMTVSANAGDGDGSVTRVDFYANSTLIGTDNSSPYSIAWNGVVAGSYTLTAVARDNAGATTTSGARSVAVNNPSLPGLAVFGASPDHTTVTRYSLDIFTQGANPATATPMATQNLGKPPVANGECSADIAATISGLPSGSYFATVVAIGPGGTSPRAVSTTFVR